MTKKLKVKSIGKKIIAVFLSLITALSCLVGMTFSVGAAGTSSKEFEITGRDVVAEACQYLGSNYKFGNKGYSNPYDSYNGGDKYSKSKVKSNGIDCSGLVYATLMNLGITVEGLNGNKTRVPVDTKNWLYTDKSLNKEIDTGDKITVNFKKSNADPFSSKTFSVSSGSFQGKVTYADRSVSDSNPYRYVKGIEKKTGTIIICEPKNETTNHAWIYIGRTKYKDKTKVASWMKDEFGVTVSTDNILNGGEKYGDYYYWRIESSSSHGGVVIDNYATGKSAVSSFIAALEVTPPKRDGYVGQVKINKYMSDGHFENDDKKMKNVKFTISTSDSITQPSIDKRVYNSSIMSGKSVTITSDSDGVAQTAGDIDEKPLPVYKTTNDPSSGKIKYTITETSYNSAYVPYKKTVSNVTLIPSDGEDNATIHPTVVSNRTDYDASATSWSNFAKRGDVKVEKNVEGAKLAGVKFTIEYVGSKDGTFKFPDVSAAYTKAEMTKTGVTNSDGNLYFCNFPIGEYKITETVPNGMVANANDWKVISAGTGKVVSTGGAVIEKTDAKKKPIKVSKRVTIEWDNRKCYSKKNKVVTDPDENDEGIASAYRMYNGQQEGTKRIQDKNYYTRGDLKVLKKVQEPDDDFTIKNDTKPAKGFMFEATSTGSKNVTGKTVTYRSTTGSDGYAYFCDIPTGTYTVKEVTNDPNYVTSTVIRTATVNWDTNVSYSVTGNNFSTNYKDFDGKPNESDSYTGVEVEFTNYLKTFRLAGTKKDILTDIAEGDGTLAGAKYVLYKDGQPLETAVTNADGSFEFTKNYVCGNGYTVKEESSSVGYLVNTETSTISVDPSQFTERNNDVNITVKETPIRGKIRITKTFYTNDNSGKGELEPDAQFEVYLTSAGSYAKANDYERDLITTNSAGVATTKLLPYGNYTIHQIKGRKDAIFMKDQYVSLQEDGVIESISGINNQIKKYIKVVKVDSETGKAIPKNQLQSTKFQIFDKATGKKITMKVSYPKLTTIDTFEVNEDGYLMTPQELKYGDYYLVEVQAPFGYYNPNAKKITTSVGSDGSLDFKYNLADVKKTSFNVCENPEDLTNGKFEEYITDAEEDKVSACIVLEERNDVQKAVINIEKKGEVFETVQGSGSIYTPKYEVKGLKGAVFEIKAKEDIVTPDGSIRYKKGTVVDTVTTDDNGNAKSKELYLGSYEVKEIKAPKGYVLNSNSTDVELAYKGQEYKVYDLTTQMSNDRQIVAISGTKSLETNSTYGLGNKGEYKNIKFGLYADEKITANDGKYIPKDGLIEVVNVDENGKFTFSADLPIEHKYYVREISTDEHYVLDNTKYSFEFNYKTQNDKVVEIKVNNGNTIANKLIYGEVKGRKIDDLGNNLAGAKFGLYREDATEFNESNAIATSISDNNGSFGFKNVPYGRYKLVELSTPKGYVFSSEPIDVNITENGQVIEQSVTNILARGKITISKSGEVFYSVSENEDGTKTPIYQIGSLPDATFEIVAKEDIVTPDGVVRFKKDEVVDTITTNENGYAESKKLFLGEYIVREVKAPKGYFLDTNNYIENFNYFDVTLEYKDDKTDLIVKNLDVLNNRQKVSMTFNKLMEQDEIFKLGNNGEIQNVTFGLFAKNDMTTKDGKQITADSIISLAKPDENGVVKFDTDLPYGYSYYIKELGTDVHYSVIEGSYEFTFDNVDSSVLYSELTMDDVLNELKRGTVIGHKTDENGKPLANATFGLFYTDCDEFEEENAILTATSNDDGIFQFDFVDYGDFIVHEITPPVGYVLNEKSYPVSVKEHSQIVNIDVANTLIRGSISVTKVDKDYPDNKLSGASFEVINDVNGDGNYNEGVDTVYGSLKEIKNSGIYKLSEIPYGHYLVKETKAPKGFTVDEKYYPIFVSENGVEYNINNNGECFIDNASTGRLKVIKTSSDKVVEGFRFKIKGTSNAGTPVDITAKTDKNGEINVPIRTGTYTISEVKGKENKRYVLPKSKTVEVKEGQISEVKFFNRVIIGTIKITKTDAVTGKVIPGATITITDKNGKKIVEGITNKEGNVEFRLEYGTYYFKESKAPKGYILDETPHQFSITKDGQIIKAVMTNKAKASVPKTGTYIVAVAIIFGCLSISFGALCIVYYRKKRKSTQK